MNFPKSSLFVRRQSSQARAVVSSFNDDLYREYDDLKGLPMSEDTPTCLYCGVDSQNAPLVTLQYQGEQIYICTAHFPILIHEPQMLAGKLPGAEKLQGHQH